METIKIKKAPGPGWVEVPLLKVTLGWVQVDDGGGPLWVMWDEVAPADRPRLRILGLPVAD